MAVFYGCLDIVVWLVTGGDLSSERSRTGGHSAAL